MFGGFQPSGPSRQQPNRYTPSSLACLALFSFQTWTQWLNTVLHSLMTLAQPFHGKRQWDVIWNSCFPTREQWDGDENKLGSGGNALRCLPASTHTTSALWELIKPLSLRFLLQKGSVEQQMGFSFQDGNPCSAFGDLPTARLKDLAKMSWMVKLDAEPRCFS